MKIIRWQYRSIPKHEASTEAKVLTALNGLGASGWEYVGVLRIGTDGLNARSIHILKRPYGYLEVPNTPNIESPSSAEAQLGEVPE